MASSIDYKSTMEADKGLICHHRSQISAHIVSQSVIGPNLNLQMYTLNVRAVAEGIFSK